MRIDRSIFKRVTALRLATPHLARGPRQGSRRSPNLGRGVEFADYRPYTPGDDLRLVDWNVYSRLEVVLVRLFHEDLNMAIQVCVDASASMDFGDPRKADHAAELGAAMALISMLNQDTVTVSCVGGDGPKAIVRGQNTNAFPQVLKLLERVEPGGDAKPWRHIEAGSGRSKPDRTLFLSDMLYEEDDVERTLRVLAATSHSPVLIHVLSEEELSPDLSDAQRITDAETGEELLIKGGRAAQEEYQQGLDAWLSHIEDRCRRLNILYVPAHTAVPVTELVVSMLRRAGVAESRTGDTR